MRIQRRSRQRETIMRILKNTKSHPTADWVYEMARQEIPNISLGTVYRNLRKLSQEGKIQKLTLNSSFDRYDADTSFHYHFACRRCGKIYDVRPEGEVKILKGIEKRTGFHVEGVKINLLGICRRCKK
ncbi:MAG: transcriptional repressor [Candidatus Zixiibacteriota bacterium]